MKPKPGTFSGRADGELRLHTRVRGGAPLMWSGKMERLILSKAFAAIAVIGLVAIAALWVADADLVILGQRGDYPDPWVSGAWQRTYTPADWTMILVPRPHFLALYGLEACVIISALWLRATARKESLTDHILAWAITAAVVVIALVLVTHRPAMPASWSKLRAGMTRQEVESLLGGSEEVLVHESLVELNHPAPMLGADGVWVLELSFHGPVWDRRSPAPLRSAIAKYGHRFRLLYTKRRKLL